MPSQQNLAVPSPSTRPLWEQAAVGAATSRGGLGARTDAGGLGGGLLDSPRVFGSGMALP
ncbi:hypothetical protein [Salinispora tropica]|uniref:hypothetical protein n=1 Tax=Salinispora tropica TaxID=168695 RepID=UPI0011D07893|nr:hypothetical protein [Salinispora tropica]